jgi:hypothetical protein
MKAFEIYFDDLTNEAKKDLLESFGTSSEEENWDLIPLAILERDEDITHIKKND